MTTEQTRQHYLRALGIETYVPRRVLPCAAPSPPPEAYLDLTEPVPEESAAGPAASSRTDPLPSATDPARSGVPTSPGAHVKAALGGETQDRGRDRKMPSSGRSTVPSSELHFVLAYWRIAPHIAVLDSRQRPDLPVERLLLNIKKALGFGGGNLPRVQWLRWPPQGAVQTGEGVSARQARAMVHAFLSAQNEKQPIGTLFLMGEDAARHGGCGDDSGERGTDGAASEPGQTFPVSFDDNDASAADGYTKAIVLPSLAAMLSQPALKAQTWKAIRHLRASE